MQRKQPQDMSQVVFVHLDKWFAKRPTLNGVGQHLDTRNEALRPVKRSLMPTVTPIHGELQRYDAARRDDGKQALNNTIASINWNVLQDDIAVHEVEAAMSFGQGVIGLGK